MIELVGASNLSSIETMRACPAEGGTGTATVQRWCGPGLCTMLCILIQFATIVSVAFFDGVQAQIIAGCVGRVGSGESDVSARRATHLWCASRFGGRRMGHSIRWVRDSVMTRSSLKQFETINSLVFCL